MIELFKRHTRLTDEISECIVHGRYSTKNIPTEFVVYEPKVCSPETCKIYDTEYVWRYDQIKKWGEIARNQNENWGAVKLCEMWYDQGDDGHVDYRLCGWAFVTDDTIKSIEQSIKDDIEKYGNCVQCFSSKLSSELYDRECMHEKR
jgi:hypothetical protein